jgi:hypothetical protein
MPDPVMLLMLKIVLVAAAAAIAIFVADYSRLTKFGWARNPLGRTIVIKDLFLFGELLLVVASVFFQFSRLTSHVAGWIQIGLLGAMALEMLRRTVMFERIHRQRKRGGDDGQAEK